MPSQKHCFKPFDIESSYVFQIPSKPHLTPLEARNNNIAAKPFVKWVGGKRSIIKELASRLPENYDKYYELFIGGGALFFHTQPTQSYISDVNHHLINAYKVVKNYPNELIKELKKHQKAHDKIHYNKLRTKLSVSSKTMNQLSEKQSIKLAGIFIYINKTCFNGLYRVNQNGGFNVPMGNYKNPNILDKENILNVSKVLQNTTIQQHSFNETPIEKNAFYYLDPPYHKTYSKYSKNGFGDEMHQQLATFCKAIHEAGGYLMLSNSDTPFIRDLYKNFRIEKVSALRSVSCKAHQRGKEQELLIRNY